MTDYTVLIVFEGAVLGRFAMAHHRARGWELPGGRVESGETVGAAARREWEEETGLSVAVLRPVLLHHRSDGSRGHVFLGRSDRIPVPGQGVDEKIDEVRFVARLADVAPLAFPDDPYAEAARDVLAGAGACGLRLSPGEDAAAFVARLSAHPQAHAKGHRVSPHPEGPAG